MTAPRQCACGAALPSDRRVKRCDACRGAAVRQQDRARAERAAEAFADSIWWLYFRNAICFTGLARGRFEEWWRDPASVSDVARAAHVKRRTLEAALREEPIDRRAFERLCAWMGWPEHVFQHVHRDPLTSPMAEAA